MSQVQRMMIVALGGLALAGCTSGTPAKRSLAAREPSLVVPGDPEPGFVAAKPAASGTSVAFVERHPLLYKPKEMYDKSGSNKLVKVVGATLIGVPAGIFGELRQIVRGKPAPAATY